MRCVYCGNKLRGNAAFCSVCGSMVTGSAAGNRGNKKRGVLIVLIVLCLVVLAAVIGGMIWLHGKTAEADTAYASQLLDAGITEYQNGDYAAAEENFTAAADVFSDAGDTDSDDYTTAVIGAADSLAEQGDYVGAAAVIDTYQTGLSEQDSTDAKQSYSTGTTTGTINNIITGTGTGTTTSTAVTSTGTTTSSAAANTGTTAASSAASGTNGGNAGGNGAAAGTGTGTAAAPSAAGGTTGGNSGKSGGTSGTGTGATAAPSATSVPAGGNAKDNGGGEAPAGDANGPDPDGGKDTAESDDNKPDPDGGSETPAADDNEPDPDGGSETPAADDNEPDPDGGSETPAADDNEPDPDGGSETPAADDSVQDPDAGRYAFYQGVLDAYSDRLENGGWEADTADEADTLISRAIAYDYAYAPDHAKLYYALVDVGNTGTAELLIAMGDTCVDAFSIQGRVIDNFGGSGAYNCIQVMDTGTLYCLPVPSAGGWRNGRLCSVDADGRCTVLDDWMKDSNQTTTYMHNGVEAYDNVDEIIASYGDEVSVVWTPLTQGCQAEDVSVQTVSAVHAFPVEIPAADNSTDYGPEVDVVPAESQMVEPYWVRCNGQMRIRSGPGQDYTGITLLPEESHCEMLVLATCEVDDPTLDYGNTWGFVQYSDNGGGYGWCYLGFTTRISDAENEEQPADNSENNDENDSNDPVIDREDESAEETGEETVEETAVRTMDFRVVSGRPDWSEGDLPGWQGHRLVSVSITGTSYPVDYELLYDGDSVLPGVMYTDEEEHYYTYDSRNRLVLEEQYINGSHYIDPTVREYDDAGLVTMEQYTEGNMVQYDYEYDAEGNVISCAGNTGWNLSEEEFIYGSVGQLSEIQQTDYSCESGYEDGRYVITAVGDVVYEGTVSFSRAESSAIPFDGCYRFNYPYIEICDAAGYAAAKIWLGGDGSDWSCRYDDDGYLVEVTRTDGTTASFVYES